jgi:thiol-disulfide isomerase/thioredoxin
MYILVSAVKIALAFVFGLAAISKLLAGFPASRKSLSDFGVPPRLIPVLTVVLPFTEFIIAVLLLYPRLAWAGSVAGLSVLLIFNAAIVANLAVGRTPTCNCFGQIYSKPIGWSTFGRNSVLAAAGALLVWQLPKYSTWSLSSFLASITGLEFAIFVIAITGIAGLLLEGFVILHVLRQNGRLLIRIEALEIAKTADGTPARSLPLPQSRGLPVGTKALPFELPNLEGSLTSLQSFLSQEKATILLFTDPNCGPCNALMPEVAAWQQTHAAEVNIVLISSGRQDINRAKAKEFGLLNFLVEKKRHVAEKYFAFGTPSAVVVSQNGNVGSQVVSGADGIRRLFEHRAWDEPGYANFLRTNTQTKAAVLPAEPALPVGSPAPRFALPDLAGNTMDSIHFNGNGTALLFWNPACGFCQRMLPQLKEWEKSRSTSAPRLVLVSSGSRDANHAMDLKATVLIDDEFAVGHLYGAKGTPTGLLLDSKGMIASELAVGASALMEILAPGQSASAATPIAVVRAS